jgi:hypothetical protein
MDGMDDGMDTDAESDACHTKGCILPATNTCERCGWRFCAAHSGELVIQRREDRSERPAGQDMLARLPTRTEVYTLCVLCRSKPVLRNLALAPPSSLKRRQS